jgi:HD-like signal output (HDOD) protein
MIERSMHVESFVSDEALRLDIAKLSSLPMLRPAERQLIDEMDKPDASLKKVAEMVECDPGLASMALRYVRAASRAVPTRVERPGQAALMLGFDTLRCLIMAAGSFRGFDARLQPLAEQLAQAGAGVACDTRKEAIKLGADESDQNAAFTAGLLHGIGILVLSAVRPEAVAEWQAQFPCEWPGDKDEIRHFGATYAGAGAYLLSLWGLSSVTVNAVAWHLTPERGAASLALDALHKVVALRKAQGVSAVVQASEDTAGRLVCA